MPNYTLERHKSFRLFQKVFVLGTGTNCIQKGVIFEGEIVASRPVALPLQWYLSEDSEDILHHVYFKEYNNAFVCVYSRHIFATEQLAEEAKCQLNMEISKQLSS